MRDVRRILRQTTEAIAIACGVLVFALWTSVPATDEVDELLQRWPRTTPVMEARRAGVGTLAWTPVPLAEISPVLRRAVVMAEDTHFLRHDGVDWAQTAAAVFQAYTEDRPLIGASTLTQQLARNLYLGLDRSVVRKAREVLVATRLEARLPKRRILELYLNVAEWGPGVFGAEAAARHHFGVAAAQLSPAQALRLAVILPAPRVRDPRALPAAEVARAASLARRLRRAGVLDDAALTTALADLRASAR